MFQLVYYIISSYYNTTVVIINFSKNILLWMYESIYDINTETKNIFYYDCIVLY